MSRSDISTPGLSFFSLVLLPYALPRTSTLVSLLDSLTRSWLIASDQHLIWLSLSHAPMVPSQSYPHSRAIPLCWSDSCYHMPWRYPHSRTLTVGLYLYSVTHSGSLYPHLMYAQFYLLDSWFLLYARTIRLGPLAYINPVNPVELGFKPDFV